MAICLLVGLSTSVVAGMVSYETDIDPTNVGSGSVVYLSQFNPALGTLTSVELYLEADAFAGSITWDNESATPTHVKLGIGATVTANAPESLTIIIVPLQQGEGDVVADNDGTPPDFTGTDSFTVTGNTGSDSDTSSPGSLGAYIGTGTFAVTLSSVVETFTSTTGGTGECASTPGQYEGKVKVTYTYVPEPATLTLLGAGAGLLLLRRRK
jgi:hypothetical protein